MNLEEDLHPITRTLYHDLVDAGKRRAMICLGEQICVVFEDLADMLTVTRTFASILERDQYIAHWNSEEWKLTPEQALTIIASSQKAAGFLGKHTGGIELRSVGRDTDG